jgi:hypothetical protein
VAHSGMAGRAWRSASLRSGSGRARLAQRAASKVKDSGKVIAIDMTDEMLGKTSSPGIWPPNSAHRFLQRRRDPS